MGKIPETAQSVVVWDPAGEYWEGGLVDAMRARRLKADGVVLLPVIPDLFRASGVAGYSKRAWGAGIALDSLAPRMTAPLTMYLDPKVRGVAWCARLVPDGATRERYSGTIMFAADSGQRMHLQGSYRELLDQPVRLASIGAPDEHGGWTVRGEGVASPPSEGHYGFALYASAPGLRVVWVAASSAPVEV